MMPASDIVMIIMALNVLWTGYLAMRTKEIQTQHDTLCSSCVHDYTPKSDNVKNGAVQQPQ
jgi:hypothetical protein